MSNVRMPVYSILAGLMGLCVVFCVFAALRRGIGWLVAAPVVWITAVVLGLGIVPAIIQGVFVAPSELQRESPYIANNIAATRAAFNLNAITTSQPTITALTQQRRAVQPADGAEHPALGLATAAGDLPAVAGPPALLRLPRR